MAKLNLQPWVANRILGFFNNVSGVNEIISTIEDDPSDGPGRTIGPVLAARILRERNQLRRRRFSTFEQLDDIRGVGDGTIQDLAYTFGTTAATAFRDSMYEKAVIYRENWPLEFFSTTIDDPKLFQKVVNDEDNFRQHIINQLQAIATERNTSEEELGGMQTAIRSAYIDSYTNSTPAAAYALALWFYEFDADNWFSWEQIQEQCIAYFDYHMESHPWDMELRVFKGFRQQGILRPGIAPADLPVVVNTPEQTITIWVSALYD